MIKRPLLLSFGSVRKGVAMGRLLLCCAVAVLVAGSAAAPAAAGETSLLRGKVSDTDGKAVAGARVFLYDSPESRRSANFMSALTEEDGAFRMTVSPGRYWAVARLKKTEGYGPLMAGDKHSGEPVEIMLAPGREADLDFTVADLKEAISAKKKERSTLIRISGRVIDENGAPAMNAYAIASRSDKVSGIPDFLSPWTDKEGRYTLLVPPGRYFLGAAQVFPPGEQYFLQENIAATADVSAPDIVLKTRSGR